MGYGWHTEAEYLRTDHWINWGNFQRTMNMIRLKDFSVKAVRDEIRTTLQNMPIDPPFSKASRFPEEGIFINLNHSVPHSMVRQLIQSLSFSDRQTEKGRSQPDGTSTREFSNLEDAKVAFYHSVFKLCDLYAGKNPEHAHIVGIYTQSTFEYIHGLTWS